MAGSKAAGSDRPVALECEAVGAIFREVTTRPVPIDLRAVKALKQSRDGEIKPDIHP